MTQAAFQAVMEFYVRSVYTCASLCSKLLRKAMSSASLLSTAASRPSTCSSRDETSNCQASFYRVQECRNKQDRDEVNNQCQLQLNPYCSRLTADATRFVSVEVGREGYLLHKYMFQHKHVDLTMLSYYTSCDWAQLRC